jgi:hypothetical protein
MDIDISDKGLRARPTAKTNSSSLKSREYVWELVFGVGCGKSVKGLARVGPTAIHYQNYKN